jgi:hypothetical protein
MIEHCCDHCVNVPLPMHTYHHNSSCQPTRSSYQSRLVLHDHAAMHRTTPPWLPQQISICICCPLHPPPLAKSGVRKVNTSMALASGCWITAVPCSPISVCVALCCRRTQTAMHRQQHHRLWPRLLKPHRCNSCGCAAVCLSLAAGQASDFLAHHMERLGHGKHVRPLACAADVSHPVSTGLRQLQGLFTFAPNPSTVVLLLQLQLL